MAQLVEHNLAKVGVAGSSPVVRSIAFLDRLGGPFSAKWPSGKAEACKAFTPGSNPGVASIQAQDRSAVFFIKDGICAHVRPFDLHHTRSMDQPYHASVLGDRARGR